MRWYGKVHQQLNFPNRYLQDSQQIHNLDRFSEHTEAKTFQETLKTKFYAITSLYLFFNEWYIKNTLINTGEFFAGEFSSGNIRRGDLTRGNFLRGSFTRGDFLWGNFPRGNFPRGSSPSTSSLEIDFLKLTLF